MGYSKPQALAVVEALLEADVDPDASDDGATRRCIWRFSKTPSLYSRHYSKAVHSLPPSRYSQILRLPDLEDVTVQYPCRFPSRYSPSYCRWP